MLICQMISFFPENIGRQLAGHLARGYKNKYSEDHKNRRYRHDYREKIKHFRNLRGISQETLGQLSGINPATIKKYEYGIRNPKPDQLLKIADALGVSINIFMDFDIEAISDVLSLLLKMDEQLDMDFEAERYEDRSPDPSTIKISFKNPLLNHTLGVYMKARETQENLLNDTERFSSEEEHQRTIEALSKDLDAVKQSILDNSKIVKKGVGGISVKIYPENG